MTLTGWILVAVTGLALFGFAMFEIGRKQHQEQASQTDNYSNGRAGETNQRDAGNRADEKEGANGNLFAFAEKHSGAFLVIVTALLTLMTGFLWKATDDLVRGSERIGNRQVLEMKHSVEAAMKAAKAAEDGVALARENARLDQRAWVAPTHFAGTPRVGQSLEVRVQYKNTGKTYARDVRPVFFAYGVPKGEKPDFGTVENAKPDGAKFLLPPNGETTSYHKVNGGRPLSPEEFRQIESGEIVIFVFGKIYYADIFGCEHWIKFSTYLDWDIKGYSAYNEYDDADDNCGPSSAN